MTNPLKETRQIVLKDVFEITKCKRKSFENCIILNYLLIDLKSILRNLTRQNTIFLQLENNKEGILEKTFECFVCSHLPSEKQCSFFYYDADEHLHNTSLNGYKLLGF